MLKKLFVIPVCCAISLNIHADDNAYTWEHMLTLESLSDLHGGVERGTRNLANLDLTLKVDTASAGFWSDGTLFIYVLGTYGRPPSALTGELQTLSNIEAYNNLTLYEFWYQHSFVDGAVTLLFGLHDYNSTFYSLESANIFTVSSLGIGPEIAQVGPSIFPITASAFHLTLSHKDQYFFLAAYDGVPGDPAHPHGTHIIYKKSDGILTAAEWGFAHEKSYKLALGGWQNSAEVENPVDGNTSNANKGYYLIGEKYFSDNVAVFFQYGHADKEKNQLEMYTGAGVVYTNLVLDGDEFGIGYARVENGAPFLKANPELLPAETVYEITYQRPLMEKLSAQTSLYYVEHPSMMAELSNSLAIGVRLYVEF